ncbi:MAG: LacI family transcriptional regulator [Verrucomicrobiales bacterium]|jgi:LacI family transcriptional regulator|nr:LacI family transcriptional regulator [Verrucomicrobiales bacterium]
MSATLKQLAEYTSLSIATVSEILNHKKRPYNEETRQRVFDAARQLGYRPNASARSIKWGKFSTIALLQSTIHTRNSLPSTLLHSIEEELAGREQLLLLGSVTDEQLQGQDSIPRILRTWAADGLLINYLSGYPQQLEEFVSRQNFPSVWINSKHGQDCIYPDDMAGAALATEYLIGLGHRNIAFVNYNFGRFSSPVHYSSLDRFSGFRQVMARERLMAVGISDDDTIPLSERLEYSKRWLSAPNRPTAVLCYAKETSIPVYIAACCLGLEVPGDLSIIHFDDSLTDIHGTKMDTLILPEQEIGRLAVEELMKKIQNPSYNFPARALMSKLVTGWTTGLAPRTSKPARGRKNHKTS